MNTISKQVKELAQRSSYLRHPKEVLQEVFKLGYRQLAQPELFLKCWPSGYIRLNPTYGEQPHQDHEALGKIFMAYVDQVAKASPFEDILTQEYDTYLGDVLGQFCTPNDVSLLIGGLSVVAGGKLSRKVSQGKPYSLYDMCCGGGSLTMGVLSQVHSLYGREGVGLMDIYCEDIDPHMAMLTSLQLTISAIVHNLPYSSLSVRCVNTLTQKDPVHTLYCIPDTKTYWTMHEPTATDIGEARLIKQRESSPWDKFMQKLAA